MLTLPREQPGQCPVPRRDTLDLSELSLIASQTPPGPLRTVINILTGSPGSLKTVINSLPGSPGSLYPEYIASLGTTWAILHGLYPSLGTHPGVHPLLHLRLTVTLRTRCVHRPGVPFFTSARDLNPAWDLSQDLSELTLLMIYVKRRGFRRPGP